MARHASLSGSLRPVHPPSAAHFCVAAARSLAYLCDMSMLAALLRLDLHPHLGFCKALGC
nr:lipoprotein signal peptidase [Neisseria shayeganii]